MRKKKSTKILTIGSATQDIFIRHKDPHMLRLYSKKNKKEYVLLEEGTKIEMEELSYYTGGGATNTAVSFSRLGFDVSTILKTGHDCQSKLIIKKLKQEHIDTSQVCMSKTLHTGVSIIIPSLSGEKTVLVYRGSNIDLQQEDIDQNFITNFDQIYITSLSGQASKLLPHIANIAKQHGIPVATNPGMSQLAVGATELVHSLAHLDILILNAQEAKELMNTLIKTGALQNEITEAKTNMPEETPNKLNTPTLLTQPITHKNICFNLRDYFCEILSRGPNIVVVTNGAEGVYVATKNTIYFQASIPTKVVSTLGAGDSFGSCFVANLLSGETIESAILYGVINSSSVISALDAQTGLLNKHELRDYAKRLPITPIMQFSCKK